MHGIMVLRLISTSLVIAEYFIRQGISAEQAYGRVIWKCSSYASALFTYYREIRDFNFEFPELITIPKTLF